ncbi:EVE domain-containing protein [Amphiplicatus metriothermophilus]|uniref:Predicted RNA-binding protein, contains PUA-like domain n=1 Tax=Amphiplicatus metriothermophilus TaxID=1519374 RepID=A0A239PY61_9PROT|nr:EVE domain-containing protein [Amphiplicatus metriothermophilus]MBB5519784.1 putative RNA-binding protein with PUA-like domain [Amphiplicatus metriothermophilus]SNT75195.1 Predicted RNA-binding protein, contains PUA-like domain [Amphiplicatus metriothermophilus]
MAYWLLKTEPDSWSWDQQKKAGAKGEPWTGVRNTAAAKNMRAMNKGDLAFFYHTGGEKAIVGVVKIITDPYPDPEDEAWPLVDVAAVEALPKPVALAAVKAEPKLVQMTLVRNARLSVQPVSEAEWKLVRRMGGLKDK